MVDFDDGFKTIVQFDQMLAMVYHEKCGDHCMHGQPCVALTHQDCLYGAKNVLSCAAMISSVNFPGRQLSISSAVLA